jgi:alkaline phosphatase D
MPFEEKDSRRNLVAVGSVDFRSARLWFRAPVVGGYVVEVLGPNTKLLGRVEVDIAAGNATDNTATVVYPDDADGAPDLLPLHRYTFRVSSTDGTQFVGEGAFETAPANAAQTPSIFTAAVVSCHQPFNSDGLVSPDSMRLLDQIEGIFRKVDAKFLLTVGDQIYADAPGRFSLLNAHYVKRWGRGTIDTWTQQQIREAYQERHRICWNQPSWLKLLSARPNYAILDDHEVFDDWGTKPEHAKQPWKKIIAGARQAYLDYQGSRHLAWTGAGAAPAALDYGFTYGTVATFVFDLRSERRAGPEARVISAAQLARFKKFLAANRQAHVILVVTSVPLVHIPEWLTEAGETLFGTDVDFPDHWSAKANQKDRTAVLKAIQAHLGEVPKQRMIVLGGDVHVGCAFTVRFVGGKKPLFYELTTSAITNRIMKPLEADASLFGPQLFGVTPTMAKGLAKVSLLPNAQGAPARNPIGGLNAALIEFRRKSADETNVRLKLVGYGPDHVAKDEFVSGWL